MSGILDLPEDIVQFIASGMVSHFTTMSVAGVPIDTPMYYFSSDDMRTIDFATGLSYPAKAERVRRDPKVGLLIEGGADEPVVLVRGQAAVRDADLAKNTVRYLAETGFEGVSSGLPWEEAREAVWYWVRIIIDVTPAEILWWDDFAAMDGPPKMWSAPADTAYPGSDPAPVGRVSSTPQWAQRSWQDMAAAALERGADAHLTLRDNKGYALPVRARSVALLEERFALVLPKWLPWHPVGKATLTFEGFETFVGETITEGDVTWLQIERTLPEHPLIRNPSETIRPSPEVRSTLMGRLEEEARRRRQSIPAVPKDAPAPTRLAKLRHARIVSQHAPTQSTHARQTVTVMSERT